MDDSTTTHDQTVLPDGAAATGDIGDARWAMSTANKNPSYDIGPHTYGDITIFHAHPEDTLRIGDYCSCAEEATFWIGGEHRPDWVRTYPFNAMHDRFSAIEGHPASKGDIVVGSDVGMGWRSTIMSGVTVGHGAVVAMGAVVVKDVEPYSIVGGVAAKKIGQCFDDAPSTGQVLGRWAGHDAHS